jgi:hypothetical protein
MVDGCSVHLNLIQREWKIQNNQDTERPGIKTSGFTHLLKTRKNFILKDATGTNERGCVDTLPGIVYTKYWIFFT